MQGVPQDGTGFMLYSHKDNTYSPAVPKALKTFESMPKTRGAEGNGRFPRSQKAENPTIGAGDKHNQLALFLAQVLA